MENNLHPLPPHLELCPGRRKGIASLLFGACFEERVLYFLENKRVFLILFVFLAQCGETSSHFLGANTALDFIARALFTLSLVFLCTPTILCLQTNVLKAIFACGTTSVTVAVHWACAFGLQVLALISFTDQIGIIFVVTLFRNIAVFVAYSLVPLSDSLPKQTGRFMCRGGGIVIILAEGSALLLRLLFALDFHERNRVIQFGVQKDDSGTEHSLVSTYDLYNSAAIIVVLLTLEVVFNSFREPEYATVVKDNIKLLEVRTRGPGSKTFGSLLFGKHFGSSIEKSCTKLTKCLTFLVLSSHGLGYAFVSIFGKRTWSGHTQVISGCLLIIITLCAAATMQIRIVAALLRNPEIWYFWLSCFSILLGSVLIDSDIYQPWSLPVYQAGYALLVSGIPLVDAAAIQLRLFVARYACVVVCAFSFVVYLDKSRRMAELYSQGNIPELGVRGIATFSLLNIWLKSQLLLCSFTAIMAYRGWRHPERTVLLFRNPRIDELHAR